MFDHNPLETCFLSIGVCVKMQYLVSLEKKMGVFILFVR